MELQKLSKLSTSRINHIKPKHLVQGSTVATVSLSWGGAGEIPSRYDAGKKQLEELFGFNVMAMPNSLKSAEFIKNNPKARADDLMQAFSDPKIDAIISNIGGDDSIRTLRYMDYDIIRSNPKPFIGYSDSTITHFVCFKAGIVSYYGPSVLSGFAENGGMFEYARNSFLKTICSNQIIGNLPQNKTGWTVEFLDWEDPTNQNKKRTLTKPTGWNFLTGEGIANGHLIGGCMEVLDWLRGTEVWPSNEKWKNAILFFETSEEAPPPIYVERFLRILGAMGILENLSGILVGRPGGCLPIEKFKDYDDSILQVVINEYGLNSMPIVTQMDFGHTDPILTLPLGINAKIDMDNQIVSITESACS
jgi:muramoyltetrapeptide carboxypeptidase LdcA involved in peptidoglycan recycling